MILSEKGNGDSNRKRPEVERGNRNGIRFEREASRRKIRLKTAPSHEAKRAGRGAAAGDLPHPKIYNKYNYFPRMLLFLPFQLSKSN